MTSTPVPLLTYRDEAFYRGGQPHRILAGAMHYFRVHPDQWRDRLRRLAAMGCNTVDTYVAWNAHQPREDEAPDFTGWHDFGAFIDVAGEEGLDVIVRPGPFICAEWDNGALPAWLTGRQGIRVRTQDPAFTTAVEAWFDALLPIITARQAAHGGPVVAVQIENEYGSYGDDAGYMRWHRQILLDRGVTELVFTADGGTDYFLDGGPLPDSLAAATLGSRGDEGIEIWRRRREGEPFFAAEFWGGWFDHWGQTEHHVRDTDDMIGEVNKILDGGGSICMYMAHGGTNFGLRSGANHQGKRIEPTVTSYDSDAPIAEDGRLTPKFHALRESFFAARGEAVPELDPALAAAPATLPAATVAVTPGADLLELVKSAGEPIGAPYPLTFEQVGLDAGLMYYAANPVLPGRQGEPSETTVSILGLSDRAQVWIDGDFIGVLDDVTGADGLKVTGRGERVRLEILVENLGRINYGPKIGLGKGIREGVLVHQRLTSGWTHIPLPVDTWRVGDGTPLDRVATATFEVDDVADTHLALPGFGKGFVWVNGFLLGRYWKAGPQRTLYVPGPLLMRGANELRIFELESIGEEVELRTEPHLGAASSGVLADAELP